MLICLLRTFNVDMLYFYILFLP